MAEDDVRFGVDDHLDRWKRELHIPVEMIHSDRVVCTDR